MNPLILSFAVESVTWLIIFTLVLWKAKTAEGERLAPKLIYCGLGLRCGNQVYYRGLWIKPAFITPLGYNGDFQFLLVNSSILPIIYHAVRGDNSDGDGWHFYRVEYATALETFKEANRIIDASKHVKQ